MTQLHALRQTVYALALGTLLLTSCNTDSFELPPPALTGQYDTTIRAGGDRVLSLHFRKSGFAGRDSVLVSAQNMTTAGYRNLKLLLYSPEDQAFPRYDGDRMHVVLGFDTLRGHEQTAYQLVSPDSSLMLGNGGLRAGILNYSQANQPTAGDYVNVAASFFKKDSLLYNALVQGFILADGSTLLRLRASANGTDPVDYNVRGHFIGSVDFTGTLHRYGGASFTTALDTVGAGLPYELDPSTEELRLRLRFPSGPGPDSSTHLLIRMRKIY